jgi:hypothetical protein
LQKKLQHSLTDAVIEQAIKQMPAEVFVISGKDIIEKLNQGVIILLNTQLLIINSWLKQLTL